MRLPLKMLLAVSLLGIVATGGMLVRTFYDITQHTVDTNVRTDAAELHFSVILPADSDVFFSELRAGGIAEALRHNAAVEFFTYDSFGVDAAGLLRQVEWINTDGVLVYLPEQNSHTGEIRRLVNASIPVVTLVNDNPLSGRTAHIGFDAEGIAREQVRLMLEGVLSRDARLQPQRWGVMVAGDGSGYGAWQGDRMESVIRNLLAPYSAIEIVEVRTVGSGYFSGEQESARLIQEYPGITGMIVAAPRTLSGVVQTLIDQNRLGSIDVVGIDTGTDIEQAVMRGLLHGTIFRHPETVGKTGIRVLMEAAQSTLEVEYHDLGYTAVDSDTIVRVLGAGRQ